MAYSKHLSLESLLNRGNSVCSSSKFNSGYLLISSESILYIL